eukprot:gene8888-3770_t
MPSAAAALLYCSLLLTQLLSVVLGAVEVVPLTASDAVAEEVCGSNSKGKCNFCVCCCYKGALPAYKPNDNCECEVVYGPSFGFMIGISCAVLVVTIASSFYFSSWGKGRFSPFRPPGEGRLGANSNSGATLIQAS